MKRECGTCTKCCEGYLVGEALGHSFSSGKPCHFVAIGTGCTVYSKRPKDPCVEYKCDWLTNLDIPEWLKPNMSNVIIDQRTFENFSYLYMHEAGSVVSSKVLNWFIQYVLNNQLNAVWQIEGGENYIGTKEFVNFVQSQQVSKM
jgi:hypothetical protein